MKKLSLDFGSPSKRTATPEKRDDLLRRLLVSAQRDPKEFTFRDEAKGTGPMYRAQLSPRLQYQVAQALEALGEIEEKVKSKGKKKLEESVQEIRNLYEAAAKDPDREIIYANTGRAPAILAHEVGHADRTGIGAASNYMSRHFSDNNYLNLLATTGAMAGGLTRSPRLLGASVGLGALGATARLVDEARASLKGLKHLREVGIEPTEKQKKVLRKAWATYLVPGAFDVGLPALGGAALWALSKRGSDESLEEFKKKLKPGDIIVTRASSTGTGPLEKAFSTLIQQATKSPWSHSTLYVGDGKVLHKSQKITSAGKYQGESSLRQHKLETLDKAKRDMAAFRPKLPARQRADAVARAKEVKPSGFDVPGLLRAGFLPAKAEEGEELAKTDRSICTALVAGAYLPHMKFREGKSYKHVRTKDFMDPELTRAIALHMYKQSNTLPGVPQVPLASNSWKVKMPKIESPFKSTTSMSYKSPNTGHMGLFKGTGNTNTSAVSKSAGQVSNYTGTWSDNLPWITTAGAGTAGGLIGQKLFKRNPILGAAIGAMGGTAAGLVGGRAAGKRLDQLKAPPPKLGAELRSGVPWQNILAPAGVLAGAAAGGLIGARGYRNAVATLLRKAPMSQGMMEGLFLGGMLGGATGATVGSGLEAKVDPLLGKRAAVRDSAALQYLNSLKR
jgi:hypothetical protein